MKDMQLFIINHYGFNAQKKKLKEEMTELAYATSEENFIEDFQKVDKRDLSKIGKAIYGNRRS